MQFSSRFLAKRLDLVRQEIQKQKLDALLISNTQNRYYLTGWQGDEESGYLLITPKEKFVITDSRYSEEVIEKLPNFKLKEINQNKNFWFEIFLENKIKRVGFEAKDLSVFQLKKLKSKSNVKWLATTDLIDKFRQEKDKEELKIIFKAVEICDKTFTYILENIKPGQTEKELAWKMENFMRELGAEKTAWDPFIVAGGKNSSKVHYGAGDYKIKSKDHVLFDWGCYYQGYATDISRVIFLGSPETKLANTYNLVLKSQEKAISQINVGVSTKMVELAAKKSLAKETHYGFSHAVGHGVGLSVHELPRVNSKAKDVFRVGNVITVEPGIYEPGWGGIRLEDMILVTKIGPKVLTKSPKEILKVTKI